MKIINVVGARPNFVKITSLVRAINEYNNKVDESMQIEQLLVHTGQHYDKQMSKLFFDDLEIPKPDIHLEVGSGTHAVQTAEIMKRFEPILLNERPDYVLVVGDVNSTIACALTASKLGIKVIHVEAGLRSFDRAMPEEINRVLTDALSDILFTTEESANRNLLHEGIAKEKIFFVGNIMIDTLMKHVDKARKSKILSKLGFLARAMESSDNSSTIPYAVLTLHRPSNVDYKERLSNIFEAVSIIAKSLPVIFPIHPRTRQKIVNFDLGHFFSSRKGISSKGIYLIEPLGYLDFLSLMSHSSLVLTDSGGIQEETTVLGIPCITLRDSTERPVTVKEGTNHVVGTDRRKIVETSMSLLHGNKKSGKIPKFWDGKASKRIVKVLSSLVTEG